MKLCTGCHTVKPLTEFVKSGKRGGYRSRCKECRRTYAARWREANRELARELHRVWKRNNPGAANEAVRKWRERNPEAVKNYYQRTWLRKYGLTQTEYEELLIRCGGRCEACGENPEDKFSVERQRRLFIDHDHATGEVCGLLCHGCNAAAGLLSESESTAIKLAGYLKKKKQQLSLFTKKNGASGHKTNSEAPANSNRLSKKDCA